MSGTTVYRNALAAGTPLLEYRLESVLGAGGFGLTYLARDIHLDKPVAIKEYFPSAIVMRAQDGGVVSTGAEFSGEYQWGLERFLQEARTLARFSHPHIVRVNRYFEANGTGYMVMDYEDGESLHQALKHDPAPAERRVRELLFPLLDGLEAVHKTGFLHRDIKPSNIFIRKGGSPVLLDFGSARQALGDSTKTLTAVLTPGYAPLEQYSGEGDQGPWTDIYALGGVLYRVFIGENPPDAVSRLRVDPVPDKVATLIGRVSVPMLRALEWAMALDEKKRPQSVVEWRRALEGKSAVTLPARSPVQAASPRSVAVRRQTTIERVRPRPTEEIGRTWRAIGKGLLLVAVFAMAYNWVKRNVVIIDEGADMEAAMAQAQQEAARMGGEIERQDRARIVKQLPQGVELLTPEQVALEAREAAVREKEQRAAEREAVLKQQEQMRARELAAVPKPVPSAVITPAEPPSVVVAQPTPQPTKPSAQSPSLEEARRRYPVAAKKEADFRRADTNGDGYLTRDEARDMPGVSQDFASIDSNGDGRVALDEFLTYRSPKPPRRQ